MASNTRNKPYKKHAWIVLGMHRSGTSALSGLLHKMGANPPAELLPPTDENPMGYWESKSVMKVNDSILEELGSSWADGRRLHLDAQNQDVLNSAKDRLRVTLCNEFSDLNNALIKDPRFCRLFPLLHSALEDERVLPLVVIVTRNPLEVARSLASRADMGVAEGVRLWLRNVLEAERATRHLPRLLITFDELIENPMSIMKQLLSFQGNHALKLLQDTFHENTIDRRLRNQALDSKLFEKNALTVGWVARTYKALEDLRKASQAQKDETAALYVLDEILRELNDGERVYSSMFTEQTAKLDLYRSFLGTPPFEEGSLKSLLNANDKTLSKTKSDLIVSQERHESTLRQMEHVLADKTLLDVELVNMREELEKLAIQKSGLSKSLRGLKATQKKTIKGFETKLEAEASLLKQKISKVAKLETDIRCEKDRSIRSEKQNQKLLNRVQKKFDSDINELRIAENKGVLQLRANNLSLSNKLIQLKVEKVQVETNLQHLECQTRINEDLSTQRSMELAKTLANSTIKMSLIERVREKFVERKIREANLFDAAYYNNQLVSLNLPEPAQPLLHYLRKGFLLGLNPHPLFDTNWYQKTYPDITDMGAAPLAHYIRYGDGEDRDPHPLFSTYWFRTNAKVKIDRSIPALAQFLKLSIEDLSSPHPNFSVSHYYKAYPDVEKAGVNALLHYQKHGHKEARNPSPTFQEGWYKEKYGRMIPDGVSALEYHLRHGVKNGHLTHPREKLGSRKRSRSDVRRKSILVVAHSASDRVFGAERSLIDVLACIDKERFNVILALPSHNNFYVDMVQPYVDDITFYSHEWWNERKPLKVKNIKFFEKLIKEKNINILYVNTIMLKTPLVAAKNLSVPSIIHVRELIDRDDALINHIGLSSKEIIQEIGNAADILIANSSETEALLDQSGKSVLIPNAINVDGFEDGFAFSSDGVLRVGMLSSNIKKKGVDELHKLAIAADKEDLPILFLAYGPETDDVRRIKNHIKSQGGPSNLIFPGYVQNPVDAIKSLDVVVNLSRFAESFGRTAVEAMSARRPIIGYNHGALTEVIDHQNSGFHIQYLRPQDALIYLKEFIKNPEKLSEMGERGYERAQKHYSYSTLSKNINAVMEAALVENLDNPQALFNIFVNDVSEKLLDAKGSKQGDKTRAQISVVIPNYNYAHFLEERIGTILHQTYAPSEIIFLDDCSSDNSLEVAKKILDKQAQGDNPIPYRVIPNRENAGVYKQWLKAVKEAHEDWVWIAEADDTSHPEFLETLVGKIKTRTSLVYCQSRKIDENGVEISPNNLAHTNDLSATKWMADYNENGVFEVVSSLAYRNSIPNISSAVFRKSATKGMGSQLTTFRYCGDWFFYAYLLSRGDVGYSRQPYNNFRRHDGGVTRQQSKKPAYLIELSRIRQYIAEAFPLVPAQIKRMNWFLNRDYKIKGVEVNSEYKGAEKYLNNAARHMEKRKRVAIITTNNGSYNGGSEMLWQETAIRLREQGHDVNVLIKRWSPHPPLFDKLNAAGIKVFFKDDNGFDHLLAQKPDLVLISIGDQDEGLEYYPRLARENHPYVIINQLTKEVRFWHIRQNKTLPVTLGYRNAQKTFFTCWNNHRVMEERLNVELSNADIHFNPYHIDRDKIPAYPPVKDGYKIAIPSKLLFVHKGQDILVNVLKQDKWRDRDVSFNFYGTGPDRENLAALIKKHNLENCFIKGRVDDIGDIWKENHAACLPSRMEGLPIMTVSAMLSARMCIATDIGGHTEVISDGVSGFIVPIPDIDDLDRTLDEAYNKRRNWRTMGKQAREDVLDYLPEDPIVDFVGKLEKIWF